MYEYIKGELAEKGDGFVVLDVGGVGYRVTTSRNSLTIESGVATFYTHLYVREDIFELYGFSTRDEKRMFEKLITVTGVGPRAAVNILSALTVPELALAVAAGDVKAISKAQGVGGKIAQRIILELKDKIENKQLVGAGTPLKLTGAENEVVEAWMALGYSAQEAEEAAARAGAKDVDVEQGLKRALAELVKFN